MDTILTSSAKVVAGNLQNCTFGTLVASNLAGSNYTPTTSSLSNLDAATVVSAHYVRIADVVIVFVKLSLDATTAAGISFKITPPIAKTFGATTEGEGLGSALWTQSNLSVVADNAAGTLTVSGTASGTSAVDANIAFAYTLA